MSSEHAYSYHTFYFPFVWDNAGEYNFDDYTSKVEKIGGWKDVSVDSFEKANDDTVANYQTVQYFTEAARKSLFGWSSDFVRCYEYEGIKNKAIYHIEKSETYDLILDGIKLKIYNTGIGILTFEAENHNYKSLKAVKAINEFGRRVFAPYIDSNGGCSLCADKLGVKMDGTEVYSAVSATKPASMSECIPEFIKHFLPETNIHPAIDDRMFVACIVNDPNAFMSIKDYKTDSKAAKSLYEFVYIDQDDWCSCPTESMRSELLDRSIYSRWIENVSGGKLCGTLHAITHHSFMCITMSTVADFVEKPFLTIYTHMVSAVLAQRAAIIALDNRVSDLSRGFEKKEIRVDKKSIPKLQELQEKHIAFLNQHMNIELTCQEQGLEIYEMLQKEMYVKDESESLSKEIEMLSDAGNIANDYRLNSLAFKASIFFGIVSVVALEWNGKSLFEHIIRWFFNLFISRG